MPRYEYKAVPAPKKGVKAPGVKTTEARFANALTQVMNEYGAAGWEYLRSETLPGESRTGMAKKITTYQSVLVFRRAIAEPDTIAEKPATEDSPEAFVLSPAAISAPGETSEAEHDKEDDPENDSISERTAAQ